MCRAHVLPRDGMRERGDKRLMSSKSFGKSRRSPATATATTRPTPRAVTQLLQAWSDGDEAALDQLLPLVESELRRLAGAYMRRERKDHTLQPTALVNELFLRFSRDGRGLRWQDRAHFMGLAARLMRRVLVDHARSRGYRKRGGDAQRVTLDEALLVAPEASVDVVALDDALEAFAIVDARKAKVVELRFFAGLSIEEAAEVLDVSVDTVKRDWRLAKLWLLSELRRGVHGRTNGGRG